MPTASPDAAMISNLVARDRARMEVLADRLRREAGVEVDILRADLTDARELAQVEASAARGDKPRHPGQQRGASAPGGFLHQGLNDVAKIISLNTMALTQLASAVVPRLVKAGEGAIINISSVVRARAGILPDRLWRNQSLCPLPHPRSSP